MKTVNIKNLNVSAIIGLNELCGRFLKSNIIGSPTIHHYLFQDKLVSSEGKYLPNISFDAVCV